jgi:hypothetical protein
MGQDSKARLRWVLIPIVFLLSGCAINTQLAQTNVELRNAVDSFDRAIDALAQQSADWQVVLQALEKEVVDDVQSTTRVELHNLMRTGLLSTGGEFRCDAEFLRIRMQRELRRIRNEFVRNLNIKGLHTPLLPEIPAEPYICSAVPAAVDLSLDEKRRAMLDVYGFDLRSQLITVEVVSVNGRRRNVTGSLAIISNQQMVLDLTKSGASLKEDSRQIVFSWGRTPLRSTGSFVEVSDQQMVLDLLKPSAVVKKEIWPIVSTWYREPQCVIPVLNPAIEIKCDTRTELVTGEPETFTPPHNRGDKEFKDHGPCVQFGLTLKLDAERRSLRADYWMDAWECPDDYCCWEGDKTQAKGRGSVTLFQVSSPNERILGYDLESSFSHQYIDKNTTDDIFPFGGIRPVEKLIYVGDTDGDDVDETKVTIYFRTMRVTVEKCESSQ